MSRGIPGRVFASRTHTTVGEFMAQQPSRRLDQRPRFPTEKSTEFEWNPVPVSSYPLSSGHWQGRRYNLALAQAAEDLGAQPIR